MITVASVFIVACILALTFIKQPGHTVWGWAIVSVLTTIALDISFPNHPPFVFGLVTGAICGILGVIHQGNLYDDTPWKK